MVGYAAAALLILSLLFNLSACAFSCRAGLA